MLKFLVEEILKALAVGGEWWQDDVALHTSCTHTTSSNIIWNQGHIQMWQVCVLYIFIIIHCYNHSSELLCNISCVRDAEAAYTSSLYLLWSLFESVYLFLFHSLEISRWKLAMSHQCQNPVLCLRCCMGRHQNRSLNHCWMVENLCMLIMVAALKTFTQSFTVVLPTIWTK